MSKLEINVAELKAQQRKNDDGKYILLSGKADTGLPFTLRIPTGVFQPVGERLVAEGVAEALSVYEEDFEAAVAKLGGIKDVAVDACSELSRLVRGRFGKVALPKAETLIATGAIENYDSPDAPAETVGNDEPEPDVEYSGSVEVPLA